MVKKSKGKAKSALNKKSSSEEKVTISPMDLRIMKVGVRGISPLLQNKFSDEARDQILNKQTGKTSQKKNRDIKAEVESKIHKIDDKTVGFPVVGFKKAMVECAPYLEGLDKKRVRGAMHLIGDSGNLVQIDYDEMVMNEAMVQLARNTRSIAFRPEFRGWKATLTIRYNASLISPEQIVNLANYAGFHIGVGDWTPQHNGSFGQFEVVTNE